jgi:predicted helicase
MKPRIHRPVITTAGALARRLAELAHGIRRRSLPSELQALIDLDELGVAEVLETLSGADLDAVLRDFGERHPREDPLLHFHELFLREYDPAGRMRHGVFCTPRPVVSFIVRSVDEVLRRQFGLADGLADTTTWGEMAARHPGLSVPAGVESERPFVTLLDPATGTGPFLVEAIDVIHATMRAKWRKAGRAGEADRLWNEYVHRHLLPRLRGVELLPAPYAVAHLAIGLKLHETGYRFAGQERAHLRLANALEQARVGPFTVVVGNPPYANFGQVNRIPFILDLLDGYKRGLGEKKLNLDDDYLKFFRLGQYLLEQAGAGVLALVTSSSYLDGLVHRRMRQSLLGQFTTGLVVDLHGNSRRGDTAPDGSADENVFDIQQGVAISLWARSPVGDRSLRHRDLWGSRQEKYQALGGGTAWSLATRELSPAAPRFFFVPRDERLRDEYEAWLPLKKVFRVIGSGLNTDRDELCIDFERDRLAERMRRVFAGDTDEEFRSRYNFRPSSSYDLEARAREQAFDPEALRVCLYRPFDFRHIYYKVGFTSRPVFEVQGHMLRPNVGLLVCRQSKEPFAVLATRHLCTHKIVAVYDRTSLAPLWLYGDGPGEEWRTPNVQLARIREAMMPEDVFHYAYAVFHSPGYRSRYADFLRSDFPRLPLPAGPDLFGALARLGGELVALHLVEAPVQTLTPGAHATGLAGSREPVVEKVSWSDGTVWLDRGKTSGFRGVPEAVWDFHIGGYRVCEKWLKDRKGRTLTADDLVHYHRIVIALRETIRLMGEIEATTEAHGGWPDAFAG